MRDIVPAGEVLSATIRLPGSKSQTNRALICAALARGESVLRNASDSDDTALMANGLNQLGMLVRKSGTDLLVDGKGGTVYGPKFPVPVGNAGTTLRFLFALAAQADRPVVFEGGGRMSERPIEPLAEALAQLGVQTEVVRFAGRYAVHGGGLRGGEVAIRSDHSSQFASAVMMAAPLAASPVRIRIEGEAVSSPYLRMTATMMSRFGISPLIDLPHIDIPVSQYRAAEINIEPDLSAAAVFIAAGLMTGGEISFAEFPESGDQGDAKMTRLIAGPGFPVTQVSAGSFRFDGAAGFGGIEADMKETPDLVPPLACALLFARGPSRLLNIGHLRHKESDRLEVLCREITKVGGKILADGTSLEIVPSPLHEGALDPEDDHRLAMSFATLGLRVPGIRIINPRCVSKSFPGFWDEFSKLEGRSV